VRTQALAAAAIGLLLAVASSAAAVHAQQHAAATAPAPADPASGVANDLDLIDDEFGVSSEWDAKARARLQEVLARREFQRRDETQWSDALRRWLLGLFDDWRKRLGLDGRMATTTVAEAVAWAVAIGAFAALVTWLVRSRAPRSAWKPIAPIAPRLSSREWVARANAALRAGDAREAIRCGYHAVLFRLEEQGVWRVDESRTPREYLSLLPANDARRPALTDLTRDFEQTWYGSRAADGHGLLAHLEVFGCSAPSERAI